MLYLITRSPDTADGGVPRAPWTRAGDGFEFEFAEKGAGSLSLGYSSHCGFGLFIARYAYDAFFMGYL
jgi:hypothetical protein